MSTDEFLTDNSRQHCDRSRISEGQTAASSIISYLMEKQLLINFFFLLFVLITSTNVCIPSPPRIIGKTLYN